MKNRHAKLKTFLQDATEELPDLRDILGLYGALVDLCYSLPPEDLRSLLPPKPWTQDKTPLLRVKESSYHEDRDPLATTYRLVLQGIEKIVPAGTECTSLAMKWSLKSSFYALYEGMEPADLPSMGQKVCVVCGGKPLMAEVHVDAGRFLLCDFCGGRWPVSSDACLVCDNNRSEKMGFFVAEDGGRRGYRAETCEICKSYIKTADREKQMDHPEDVDVEDVITLSLDVLAHQRGYRKINEI